MKIEKNNCELQPKFRFKSNVFLRSRMASIFLLMTVSFHHDLGPQNSHGHAGEDDGQKRRDRHPARQNPAVGGRSSAATTGEKTLRTTLVPNSLVHFMQCLNLLHFRRNLSNARGCSSSFSSSVSPRRRRGS